MHNTPFCQIFTDFCINCKTSCSYRLPVQPAFATMGMSDVPVKGYQRPVHVKYMPQ